MNRTIQLVYASMLVGLFECLPLGVLQACAVDLSFILVSPGSFHALFVFRSYSLCNVATVFRL